MTTAKEMTIMKKVTCLAVATAMMGLASCTDIVNQNEPPKAKVEIMFNGTVYASGQGIESADGSDLPITLDGSKSSDDDGELAEFLWIATDTTAGDRMAGTNADLGNSSSINVTLGIGTHRITLWVKDNEGGISEPASVTIVITSAAACLAVYSNPEPGCAECLCKVNDEAMGVGGCRDEIMACMANPDPTFASLCTDIVNCAVATGCSSLGCYDDATCKVELEAATADYGGFPAGCQVDPGEAPCPTATAIATCRDMSSECMAICGIMPAM